MKYIIHEWKIYKVIDTEDDHYHITGGWVVRKREMIILIPFFLGFERDLYKKEKKYLKGMIK